MPKIILDYQKCIFCGLCTNICPDLFKWNADKAKPQLNGAKEYKKRAEIQINNLLCAEEAIEVCPVNAIYTEDSSVTK